MRKKKFQRQVSASPSEHNRGPATTGGRFHRVGLLDHIGLGNMGDTAIQEVFIANIKRRLPSAAIVAFSLNPADTRTRHHVESYPITPFVVSYSAGGAQSTPSTSDSWLKRSVKQIRPLYASLAVLRGCMRKAIVPVLELTHILRSFRIVRSLDLLIISGGGQLCDLWSGMPYNLFKFSLFAKLSRTKLFIVSVGAGPLRGRLTKMLAASVVRSADYISFRDVESLDLMRSLYAGLQGSVCPDPAYSFNVQPYQANESGRAQRIRIGLNPTGYCDPRVWPVRNEGAYRSYIDKLTELSLWLLEKGCDIELFTTDNISDRYAIQDLQERLVRTCSLRDASRITTRPLFDLQDVLHQIAGFDIVITPKFHGVIFSHILSKPVVALSYHPKIWNLMRAAGHERQCFDIGEFATGPVVETLDTLLRHGDELRDSYRETVAAYGAAVQAQFDHLFMPQLKASLLALEQQCSDGTHRELVHPDLQRRSPACDGGAE